MTGHQQLLCRHVLRLFVAQLVATSPSEAVDPSIATALKKTAQTIYKVRADEVQLSAAMTTAFASNSSSSSSSASSITTSKESMIAGKRAGALMVRTSSMESVSAAAEEDADVDITLSGCVELLIEQVLPILCHHQYTSLRQH